MTLPPGPSDAYSASRPSGFKVVAVPGKEETYFIESMEPLGPVPRRLLLALRQFNDFRMKAADAIGFGQSSSCPAGAGGGWSACEPTELRSRHVCGPG